jgi:Zn-finger protein
MELILNHNKSTKIDYFIFFPCRADHNKVTQKFSPFYPTLLITYEIGKKQYHLIISKKGKKFFPPAHSLSLSSAHPRSN